MTQLILIMHRTNQDPDDSLFFTHHASNQLARVSVDPKFPVAYINHFLFLSMPSFSISLTLSSPSFQSSLLFPLFSRNGARSCRCFYLPYLSCDGCLLPSS